jgi:acetamidase/formamidase
MTQEHVLTKANFHTKWDNSLRPALEINPGDVVHLETSEVSGGQVTPGCSSAALASLDLDKIYPLTGPILVNGAEPGDALSVELLELRTQGWAWTGIIPGLGLLKDDFTQPYIYHWDLSNGRTAEFRPGIVVPLDPFPGTIGVAPRAAGQHFVMPPGAFGGNMDIRHLHEGTTLYLPVQVSGALFSVGDCHAGQGDGEVCVTGLEAPMELTLRFGLLKGANFAEPRFVTKGTLNPKFDGHGYYATTSHGPDLYVNAQNAVRYTIDWLTKEKGLSREDAYLLCSAVGDLKISEIVDQPNWIASFYTPLGVFVR